MRPSLQAALNASLSLDQITDVVPETQLSQLSSPTFPDSILHFAQPNSSMAQAFLTQVAEREYTFSVPLKISISFAPEGKTASKYMKDSLLWTRDDVPFSEFELRLREILKDKLEMPGQIRHTFCASTVLLSFVSKLGDRQWRALTAESWSIFNSELSNQHTRTKKISVNIFWKVPEEIKVEELSFTVFSQVCRCEDLPCLFGGEAKHITGSFNFSLSDTVPSGTLSKIFEQAKQVCANAGRHVVIGSPLFVRSGCSELYCTNRLFY